jgi:protein required for attachment to host cells
MNPSTWIVVADSSRALIFSIEGSPKRLHPVRELNHPESRMTVRALVSDKPGRAFERKGNVQRAMTQAFNPKTMEKRKFSLELAHALDIARKEGFMDRLVLVAAPAFLGDLRSHLTRETARLATLELPKNLSQLTAREIQSHLPVALFQ